MTKVIYLSGCHGSGKTSILKRLYDVLLGLNLSVIHLPEFVIKPSAKIGTMKFQLEYQASMRNREQKIDEHIRTDDYDFVLADRSPLDVDIYTKNIYKNFDLAEKSDMMQYNKNPNKQYILIRRNINKIIEGIAKRLSVDTHRASWNETNVDYLKIIINLFDNYYPKSNILYNDGTIEESVDRLLEIIY